MAATLETATGDCRRLLAHPRGADPMIAASNCGRRRLLVLRGVTRYRETTGLLTNNVNTYLLF
ncbi:hypothetical protein [Melghirimyces thermohalophilus]|uniref:hypothetical protein n=1 Tax=Melghirimyces thermohalophilus TaxID=1236220 RepID=UPI00115FB0ED|nr:hypothetical protein [Melghirimyces thermohalophilus]